MTEKYPQEVIADMIASSPLNAELCEALAEKWNRKLETDRFTKRGFIAKTRTVKGVEYSRKPAKITKTGDPVERKSQIVDDVAKMLGISSSEIESIEKGGKEALQALRDAVASIAPAMEEVEDKELVEEPDF